MGRDPDAERGFLTAATVVAVGLSLIVVAAIGAVVVSRAQTGLVVGAAEEAAREVSAAGADLRSCSVVVTRRIAELAPSFRAETVACRLEGGVLVVSVTGMAPSTMPPVPGARVHHEARVVMP